MQVRDAMETSVATIDAATPLEGVADLMRARHCDVLPVAQDGRFLGLITADDVLLALVAPPAAGATTSAQVVRTAPIHDHAMIGGDEPVSAAARRMAQLHVDHLAVVDDDRVVGVVRLADVAPQLQRPVLALPPAIAKPLRATGQRAADAWHRVRGMVQPGSDRSQSGTADIA